MELIWNFARPLKATDSFTVSLVGANTNKVYRSMAIRGPTEQASVQTPFTHPEVYRGNIYLQVTQRTWTGKEKIVYRSKALDMSNVFVHHARRLINQAIVAAREGVKTMMTEDSQASLQQQASTSAAPTTTPFASEIVTPEITTSSDIPPIRQPAPAKKKTNKARLQAWKKDVDRYFARARVARLQRSDSSMSYSFGRNGAYVDSYTD